MFPRVERRCRLGMGESRRSPFGSEQGIALLIVVSVLTVIGIMGVAFAFSMYLESQASRQFVATVQARYIAEAGVNHARAILDEDRFSSRVVDLTGAWQRETVGHDADTDGDGVPDAAWWIVKDAQQRVVGRYALRLTDESGKANLHAAQAEPSPRALGAVNLTMLLEQAGIDAARARKAAEAIEQYRNGPDQRPGVAGVDDDRNGAIDDVSEYQPLALRGDDRRIEGLDELQMIAGLSPAEISRLTELATVYSWDANVSVTGKARVNVNTATAEELVPVLLEAGVHDPWQTAVNMADYVDQDVAFSQVHKAAQALWISAQGSYPGWKWQTEPEGHYKSDGPGDIGVSWTVAVPTGTFHLRALGLQGMKVGDVTINGQTRPSMDDGGSLGVFTLQGTATIQVANREAQGTPCAFRGVELVSESTTAGSIVRGVEAIRFNEVMVEPLISLTVKDCSATSTTCQFDGGISGWGMVVGTDYYTNGGAGKATWTWSTTLPQGRYYLRVFGTAPGETVGAADVNGVTQRLMHGARHPMPLLVGADGNVRLALGKSEADRTYYIRRIELSVQPDGEYIELINLSDQDVSVGRWTIDGELAGGRQGRFPPDAVVKAHGLLVAAVDLDDTQTGLSGNGISARSAWDMKAVNAVQLEFPSGAPTPDDDWLKVTTPGTPSGAPPGLVLRAPDGSLVDQVGYPLPLPTTSAMQSLEKGDPSVIVGRGEHGLDLGWFPSLKLYTPGAPNDNAGLTEVVDLKTIVHDPQHEVTVLNRPLGGVGELAGLPSGEAWKPFSSIELAGVVDRLTVEGYRLEVAGHDVDAEGRKAWAEQSDGSYVHTDPAKADIAGTWRWTDLPEGTYRVSLYGGPGEQFALRWEQANHAWTEWSPALTADVQGRVLVGQVTIGMGETSAALLTLQVQCASASGVCHFFSVQCDPQLIRLGPVNINTAPLGVLMALPGMSAALVSRIIAGRPYGDQEQKGRGIGDLLLGDVLGSDEEQRLAVFRQVAHLLTTRSDVFQIVSLGEALTSDRVEATQRINTVIQR